MEWLAGGKDQGRNSVYAWGLLANILAFDRRAEGRTWKKTGVIQHRVVAHGDGYRMLNRKYAETVQLNPLSLGMVSCPGLQVMVKILVVGV